MIARSGSVLAAFAEVASTFPDRTAIHLGGRRLSYRELDRRSNQVARRLSALGVGPEVCVALQLERSFDWVTALLAVWKAGGAFVPVDPAYPSDRIAFMLDDVAAAVTVTNEWLAERFLHDFDVKPLGHAPAAGQLAYVMYTSGSTGRPKGVLIEHRGLVNLAAEQIRAFGVTPESRVLQFASPSFDASISEVLMALLSGAALHLAPRSALLAGPALLTLLQTEAITTVTLPPSLLAILQPGELPALRTVAAAGEACSAEVVSRWAPGRRFLNAYGPTEITVCATIAQCLPSGDAPPIGRTIAHVEAHIVDEQGRPAAVGELYLGGVGLARGYHRRPQLTAAGFVPNPFGPGRLYRTGDRARVRADGTLEFLGRLDQQIKIRGHRVEPGEIEAALRALPAVLDAVVVLSDDGQGHPRLVGYVVGDQLPNVTALRLHLAERLPEYMIPSAFVALQAFPLTPNGKIDRRALPPPPTHRPALAHAAVSPRDRIELVLTEVWKEALGLDVVGVTDDFIALGGGSLLAMRVVAGLQTRHRLRLSPTAVLEASTIERLADIVRAGGDVGYAPLVHLRRGGERRPFFLVHPVNGSALCYVELARLLGSGRPLFGLQAEELGGHGVPVDDLRALATRYVGVMREAQPRGPYLVGGWSAGGIIGFEIARQLRAMGEEVADVVLIDARQPTPHGIDKVKELTDDYSAAKMAFWYVLTLGRCVDVEIAATHEDFARRRGDELDAYVVEQLRELVPLPPSFGPGDVRPLLEVYRATLRAIISYRPEPYPGPITLLRTTGVVPERPFAPHPPPWRWETLATQIQVRDLPGNHFNLLSPPYVSSLAEALREVLDLADRR